MKRKWIFRILIIGFLWAIISHFTEIEKIIDTLSRGKWQWLLLAILLQIIYYIAFAGVYHFAFRTVGVESKIKDLLPVLLVSIFTNVAAPSGGTSGMAVFVDDAVQRGQSPAKATTGTLLALIADFSSFFIVLISGMIYLFLMHDLKLYEITGAILLILLISGLTGIMLLGLWSPKLQKGLLKLIEKIVNKGAIFFKISPPFSSEWAEKQAEQFAQASKSTATRPFRVFQTIFVAFIAHILDMVSIYVLFLAFWKSVSPGMIVAGYSMGVLFWIVSPTPQGIGVVEGMMTIVFNSLGVPLEKATVISIAFRGFTFWIPLLIGFFLLRKVKTFGSAERSRADLWIVKLVALLTSVAGAVNLISSVTPALYERLLIIREYLPLAVRHGSHLFSAISGFLLIILSINLWRRKRIAWIMTLIILLIAIVSHITKGLDYEEAIFETFLFLWLWSLNAYFHASSDRPSLLQGIKTLIISLIFTIFYGTFGFYLLDRHFRINFSFVEALKQTFIMFTSFSDPGLEPVTGFGKYFLDSIYIVALITFVYSMIMLLRPVLLRQNATDEEMEKARSIVEKHGRSSLARLTLLNDKSYYFSSENSLIPYVLKGRIALSLGDPIGPLEEMEKSIVNFKEFCEKKDWMAAFYQTLPDHIDIYKKYGFKTLCIGQEGIVDLKIFTLQGKAGKALRPSFNKLTKQGYRAEVHKPPVPENIMAELRIISDEWLTMMHGSEKRFSLGWFDDGYIKSCPLMAIYSPEGIITAFANITTEYNINEITVDLMRRRKEVENGTMDFLFISLFEWAKKEGYDTFNLGMSPLYGVGKEKDDPNLEKAINYIYKNINQFYNFQGLHAFKEKFHPSWSPRYIIYPGVADIMSVWIAIARANNGEDVILEHVKDYFKNFIKKSEIKYESSS